MLQEKLFLDGNLKNYTKQKWIYFLDEVAKEMLLLFLYMFKKK